MELIRLQGKTERFCVWEWIDFVREFCMLLCITELVGSVCRDIITPRAHARSGVKQSVLSVSLSVSLSVCHAKKIEISPHTPS